MKSSDPLRDYSSWHAALTIFKFQGVDNWQVISYSQNKTQVFDEVTDLLHVCYEDCFIPYDDYIFENRAQIFSELYPDREEPDAWSNWDLVPLLKELLAQARLEIENSDLDITQTVWHSAVEQISGYLAPDNCGLVVLEGAVPDFVPELLAFKTRELKRSRRPYDAIATHDLQILGQIYLLADAIQSVWSNPYWQTASAFDRMAARFNEAYGSKL